MTSINEQKMLDNTAAIRKLKDENRDLFKDVLAEKVKHIFNNYPHLIECIKWTQYTPYWNDGSPCTFSVHDPDIFLKSTEEALQFFKLADIEFETNDDGDKYIEGYSIGHKARNNKSCTFLQDLDQFKNFIQTFDDESESLFGDHQKILCTANDIQSEDYEHD